MLELIRNLGPSYIFVLGVILGSLITTIIISKSRSYAGVLKIDRLNPEKDLYFLEINNLENLSKQKEILLKVDNDADLTQK